MRSRMAIEGASGVVAVGVEFSHFGAAQASRPRIRSGATVIARNEGHGLPICERLRRTRPSYARRPYKSDARAFINPDGPEAAAVIEAAIGALERIAAIPITDIYARPEQPCVIARAALAKVQVPHD